MLIFNSLSRVNRDKKSQSLLMTSSSLAFAIAAATMIVPQNASAQSSVNADEIIVTARKKAETLNTVPLSIKAFTEKEIERAGIASLDDVANATPGLTFDSFNNGNFAIPTIRGVAQTDITNVENNVSVFLNGIYLSNKQSLDVALIDVSRIEVVKGPQNALYGRNSFAGAINYVTSNASPDAFGAKGELSVGTDEFLGVKGSVNLPIADNLALRLSAGHEEFDGTVGNSAAPDDNLGGYEKTGIMGALHWAPADNFEANLFHYRSDLNSDHSATYSAANNCGFGVPSFGFTLPVNGNFCGSLEARDTVDIKSTIVGAEKETSLTGLNLDWSISDKVTLTSLTSYGETENFDIGDNDFSSAGTDYNIYALSFPDFIPFPTGEKTNGQTYTGQEGSSEDFSQEFRVDVDISDQLNLSAGVFYSKTELSDQLNLQTVIAPDALTPPFELIFQFGVNDTGTFDPTAFAQVNKSEFEFETKAIFGAADISLNEDLRATVEMRYTEEDRSGFLQGLNQGTGALIDSPGAVEDSFSFFTPRFILDYTPDQNSLVYASAARGAKSGGFNNTVSTIAGDQRYDEETNWSYELGYKRSSGDGLWNMQAAVYYIDWTDLQIQTFSDANVSVIQNVDGGATVKGGEIQLGFNPTDDLSFSGGYAYSDPKFVDNTFTTGVNARACGVTSDILCELEDDGTYNAGGNQLARTSQHQANASVTYSRSLANDFDGFARLDVNYQSKQFVTALNVTDVPARTLANARIGVNKANWGLELWGRNIFDESYTTSAVRFNLPDAFPVFTPKPFIGFGSSFGATLKVEY